ncbi:hypothetical protein [Gordonia sp. SID5947]|uniref:hypothetical protein n=1 Tax=Gordonia sp. SID5947 TaxID=2690315 RepID=UPI001925388E|nr:hypothetical protein [Gordonia sp. SID5947]
MTGSRPEWFADIPAWPATGESPARELARALADARLVTAAPPRSDSASFPPAEPSAPRLESIGDELPQSDEPIEVAPSERPPLSDDDLFEQMRVRTVTPKGDKGPKRFWTNHRGPIVGAAAAVVVVGVAAALAIGKATSGDDPATDQAAAPSSSAAASTAVGAACPSTTERGVTTGNDAGDQNSGPGVIKAFNHAYYVERSASAARAVAAPNAVASRDVMQRYIDQRSSGTQYCLSITARGKTTYDVVLTEIPPESGAVPIVYRQRIQTVEARGKTWIASIKSVE